MKIFRLKSKLNEYQSFLLKDTKRMNDLIMDCNAKKDNWKDFEFYILQLNLKKGNFFGGIPGSIIIDEVAKMELASFWEASGELLPFVYKDVEYYLFNCLHCYDLLDEKKTEWIFGKTTNKKIRISKYHFYPERITETPLFKIPETLKAEILVVDRMNGDENFINQVKEKQLTGLYFEEIWEG